MGSEFCMHKACEKGMCTVLGLHGTKVSLGGLSIFTAYLGECYARVSLGRSGESFISLSDFAHT